MELTPRYEGPAVLRFDVAVGDPAVPLVRQRRRLGAWLAALGPAQWSAPTRCQGWTVRDVIAHLVGTDQFWFLSAAGALAGEPTRYLQGFDPVATPAQMVSGMDDGPEEVLARFVEAAEALGALFTGLDAAQWAAPAEAPPGHVALAAMAHHALWDAWIHERDVVIPAGDTPVEEPDEVLACLRYAAVVGPALAAGSGSDGRTGALVVDGTDPDAHLVVEVGETVVLRNGPAPAGAVRLAGPTVDLVEALSCRAPLAGDVAAEDRWLLGGLAAAFDQPVP
jgi:uncharacterized protein (TIGR03083 family)